MPYKDTYDNFTGFFIESIKGSDTGPTPGSIDFEYNNPAIGIDTGGNYVTHDIIGGATVRQRIGDKPLEVDISGICTEETAGQLELLRNAKYGTIHASRLPTGSVQVHFVSINTTPMEDGGSADMNSGEFLYSYTLNCVEILDTGD